MKQLQLRDGDLVLGSGGLGIVEGAARLAQDLGCAVREEIGTDRFHPKWGSTLNDFIGREADVDTASLIQSEMGRVIQNYVVIQSDQITKDSDAGLRSRFKSGDVIVGIGSIQTQRQADKINVRASVQAASGETVTVTRTVGSQ